MNTVKVSIFNMMISNILLQKLNILSHGKKKFEYLWYRTKIYMHNIYWLYFCHGQTSTAIIMLILNDKKNHNLMN